MAWKKKSSLSKWHGQPKASGKRIITMNLCGKLVNNFLHLCCCVVVFIPLTRGKTVEVLHLDDSSCTAWPTFGDGKGPKKSQRAKRKFWGQQVSFGTKFLKFGLKRANLATLAHSHNFKRTFEDLLPCNCYAMMTKSTTIRKQVSQPASAGKVSVLFFLRQNNGSHSQ